MLRPLSQRNVQRAMGTLLRTGVLLAAAVILLGGAIYLIRSGGGVPDYRKFHGQPLALRNLNLIQFGLLILIATPVLRVVFSLVVFVVKRDRLYALITAVVLTILLVGVFGSRYGF